MPARQRTTRRLGRGLASLMSNPLEVDQQTPKPVEFETAAAPAHAPAVDPADKPTLLMSGVASLPIDLIDPNPHQPRHDFDESSLRGLADSILSAGLVQPIVVRPSSRHRDRYELIAGERRLRAARLAGLSEVSALVRESSDQQSAEFALIENLQRDDLNPIDRAEALQSLLDRFDLTQSQLAERVSMQRPTVANLLRLNELPQQVKDLIRAEKLSAGHAKVLLRISDNNECIQLSKLCIRRDWSVRRLEQELASAEQKQPKALVELQPRAANIVDLERRLGDRLGTKVALREGRKKGTGRIVIEFYDLDQFDGLLAHLGVSGDA